MHGPVGFTARHAARSRGEHAASCCTRSSSFHSFLWASGGCFSDFYIHNIDECCWMKDAWPVKAQALGGRHYRGDYVDQNFDTYSVEYTFADGTKLLPRRPHHARLPRASSPATPTARKGSAVISTSGAHAGHAAASTRARTSTTAEPGLGLPAAGAATRTSSSGTT